MALTQLVGFHGCCGANIIYLNAHALTSLREDLADEIKTHLVDAKGRIGLCTMILTEAQHDLLFTDLKVMGWTKFKTPAKNPNTSNDLHLYMIDINKFEAKKAKKVFG